MSAWIGVDTGGTFTDLVCVDGATGSRIVHKLPTTKDDPARAILAGLETLLAKAGAAAAAAQLVHGTTLATNALLEGTHAPTGMLTTVGFRDVLEIGRQRRPSFFNLDVPKPTPPARRDAIMEIPERLAEDGAVVEPLDEAAVKAATARLKAKGVETVAVCFLHSYANPGHEQRAEALLRELWPQAYVCRSSAVLREFREFERFATTCINASLMPVIDRYLARFEEGLSKIGFASRPLVMQSNGGAASCAAIRKAPVNTFVSGPAGGVIAAAELGCGLGIEDAISFDMGGTSTDVCLIRNGAPGRRAERELAGFPVRVPLLDIHTVGAGGGSIAWTDPGGLLKVGPRSAGADPGPALYGRGGTEPTVTDANVVLGRLSGDALIGGAMTTYPERSKAAVSAVAGKLLLDTVAAAAGIIAIVNANMTGAVRVVTVERGEDPRGCTLIAFGGAGPLHAAEVAEEIGIRRVVVPRHPGLLSALGLLGAEVRGDFSATCLTALAPRAVGALRETVGQLDRAAARWIEQERLEHAAVRRVWAVDLRYAGQSFQIRLPLDTEDIDEAALAGLATRFHLEHEALNGYAIRDQPVEVVNLHIAVSLPRAAVPPARVDAGAGDPLIARRPVWFAGGFVETPIYARDRLSPDTTIDGPAVVEQMDATTLLPLGWRAVVDATGDLILDRRET